MKNLNKGVSASSKEAYALIEKLPEKRRAVFEAIKALGECCDMDIALHLGWPINKVTGRRYELEGLGLVQGTGRKPSNHSEVKVNYWKIKNEE
jgi:hypothetical protein